MTVDLEEKVIQTFQYLHQHPEISWEEKNTTRYIKELLAASGCKVTVFPDCTGVVGEYGTGKNVPVVGIRADMDALWQNVDGTFQANHSCGHDAHMAMVLGVLWKLEQHPELASKLRIKFIFQPAEETGEGALKMVEKNVIDDVDFLFGVHLRPGQEMKMGQASPVIVHGATKVYEVEIRGEDAHGARPHLNVNAIEVGADIVHMLAKIHLNPQIPYSVKMTRFNAGGKSANIIPGNAEFALDLRAQTNEAMKELEKQVESIFAAIRTRYNIQLEVVNKHGIVAAIVNQEATEIMKRAIIDVLGEEGLVSTLITPGGDDFHFYTIKKADLKATMLGLGCDLSPGLHHPHMTFKKEALIDGVNILYRAILHTYQLTT